MNRWTLSSLVTGLLAVSSGAAAAEEKPGIEESRHVRRQEELSRQAIADRLRFERARRRANERIAREEMFERMGYSPLRPYTSMSAMSFGSVGGPYPHRGDYSRPPWAW